MLYERKTIKKLFNYFKLDKIKWKRINQNKQEKENLEVKD